MNQWYVHHPLQRDLILLLINIALILWGTELKTLVIGDPTKALQRFRKQRRERAVFMAKSFAEGGSYAILYWVLMILVQWCKTVLRLLCLQIATVVGLLLSLRHSAYAMTLSDGFQYFLLYVVMDLVLLLIMGADFVAPALDLLASTVPEIKLEPSNSAEPEGCS